MNETVITLQKEAARILQEDIVDVVIGFAAGTVPLKSRPVLIRRPDAANDLVMDGFCRNNLATYLTRRPAGERIGIVCRGCESRAVRALVIEQQCTRDRIYVIGIPCHGILDEPKILSRTGEEILWAKETDGCVIIGTSTGETRMDRGMLLHAACSRCRYPNPIGADITIGEPVVGQSSETARHQVDEFETLDTEARHAFFTAEAGRCIRCYTCREACPMCYCAQCFVDHAAPRWTDSTVSPAGTQAWHLIRAFHQTGRCVSCGACERACPLEIRMTYLTDKLNLDVAQAYGFVPGEDERQPPPFASFCLDDAKRFEQ